MTISSKPATVLLPKDVPLRTGPPTREELLVYYPAKFTWTQLKTFVNSGDLGLLKRDKKLQARLQWGKCDILSLLTSALDVDCNEPDLPPPNGNVSNELPPLSDDDAPKYFSRNAPSEYLSIIQNDWPYSGNPVPPEIEHTLIWTRLPIYHESLVAKSISARVEQDGLWGFTGSTSPPPSPSILPSCLPALSDWGITMDKLIRSTPPTAEEAELLRRAGEEIQEFIRNRWDESRWETAWFVNPPRLQSVPDLAHIHVFARQKH
ncbi:hypothetical protein C0995_004706 [Termitomyces sp. Mi166|nr:hypothetical protein C0995_004706 [Termitomyces sp. Mi166\